MLSFLNLNVTAGNGNGTAQDVTQLKSKKSFFVKGTFIANVTIEATIDGTNYVPIARFDQPTGDIFTIDIDALYVRVRVSNYVNGSVRVGLCGESITGLVRTKTIDVNTSGAGVATSVGGLASGKSIFVDGSFLGVLKVQISADDTDYMDIAQFDRPTDNFLRMNFDAQYVRVVMSNYVRGTPVVTLAAIGDEEERAAAPFYDKTGETLTVYLDADNGDDANSGQSETDALQTLAALYRKYPLSAYGGSRILVMCAAGTYTPKTMLGGGGEAQRNSYCYRGPEMELFTPTTGPSTAAPDVTPCVIVGKRTRFDFNVSAPGWTVNDLRGQFLRVSDAGGQVFFELPISENTADTIFVDTLDIVGDVSASDTIEIVTPAAQFGSGFAWIQLLGHATTLGPFADDVHTFERIKFGGILASTANGVSFDRCQLVSPYFFGTTDCVNCSSLYGFYMCADSFDTTAINSRQGDVSLTDPTVGLMVDGKGFGNMGIGGTTTRNAIKPGVWNGKRPLGSYNSGIDGIVVIGRGSALYMNTGVALLGDDNDDVGLHCVRDGYAKIDIGVTTITGGGGDLQVGAGAAVAYGTGAGQFSQVAGWANNLSRRLEVNGSGKPTGDDSTITTLA